MTFLNNKYARVLSFVLLLQAVAFYAVARRQENIPNVGPLSSFASFINGWQMIKDLPIEKEVQDVLRADDTLNRVYVNPARTDGVSLFIAFFKTQRYGQSPHSPKNCLPAAGWEPTAADRPVIEVPGWPTPIQINRYVVQHGDEKSVVLYWYQSHNRVIANEFAARFWLVADSIRFRRSDTALVKVVVGVRNDNVEGATAMGYQFTKAIFPALLKQLPL